MDDNIDRLSKGLVLEELRNLGAHEHLKRNVFIDTLLRRPDDSYIFPKENHMTEAELKNFRRQQYARISSKLKGFDIRGFRGKLHDDIGGTQEFRSFLYWHNFSTTTVSSYHTDRLMLCQGSLASNRRIVIGDNI